MGWESEGKGSEKKKDDGKTPPNARGTEYRRVSLYKTIHCWALSVAGAAFGPQPLRTRPRVEMPHSG